MMAFRITRFLALVTIVLIQALVGVVSASAANRVSYLGNPLPPVNGVLLPETPTTLDRVVYHQSLGFTFTNSCFAASMNGNASITIDPTQRIVSLDFDETTATLTPLCSGEFAPVSTMQLELDPLPAGAWTLEVDEMFTIFLPRSAQTIEFEVSPTGTPVPTGTMAYLASILIGSMLVVGYRLRSRARRSAY